MAFSVYKSPICGQSRRVIEKRKKVPWRTISGFQQCNFYSDIMLCCWDILLVLKSQLFMQNWQFFVYNFAKKMKIEISKNLPWRKRRSTA